MEPEAIGRRFGVQGLLASFMAEEQGSVPGGNIASLWDVDVPVFETARDQEPRRRAFGSIPGESTETQGRMKSLFCLLPYTCADSVRPYEHYDGLLYAIHVVEQS